MIDITCLTLSKTPIERELPKKCKYINYTSTFKDECGYFISLYNAIKILDTEFVIICDYDDPFPNTIPSFSKGIMYGDYYCNEIVDSKVKKETIIKVGEWERITSLDNYHYIHKPVMKSECLKNVMRVLYSRNFHLLDLNVQYIIFNLIAFVYGSEYKKDFVAIWNKSQEGFHNYNSTKFSKSKRWLNNNLDSLKSEL